MPRFTVIPEATFNELQVNAGVLLKRFNPASPDAPADEDIITATTGGITASCVATYSDYGEDVDNCPPNMMELKHLDGWGCTLSTTALGTSAELIKLELGAADIDGDAIIPRRDLKQSDFTDVWFVGDRSDGGMVAIQLKNALSTGGFSLRTTKNGKGNIDLTLTGHVSINAQDVVPMVFYSADPDERETWEVKQILSHVTSDYRQSAAEDGEAFESNLTAEDGYTIANVIVTMGGVDVTSAAYSGGTVSIASVDGAIVIVATASET